MRLSVFLSEIASFSWENFLCYILLWKPNIFIFSRVLPVWEIEDRNFHSAKFR